MSYHQTIAASCDQTSVALSQTLSAHGYRLERSFDLRSVRYTDHVARDQYLILLAYEQTSVRPPVVITLHESHGVTRLQIDGWSDSTAVEAALEEAGSLLLDTR